MCLNVSEGIHGAMAINKVYGDTILAKSSSAANTVEVSLTVRFVVVRQRQIIIYHNSYLLNVDTWEKRAF